MSRLTAWQHAFITVGKGAPVLFAMVMYAEYYRKNTEARSDSFKNKSRLFGGLKNPQY
jgi:hypothetical protein